MLHLIAQTTSNQY